MNLLVENDTDIAIVTVNSEQLDVSNADDFRKQMESVLHDYHKVALDLGRVEFVDSRGCGALLSCLKNVTEAGGDLKLFSVTGPVRTVFDLIRLHRICEILDTKAQAIQAFRKSGR